LDPFKIPADAGMSSNKKRKVEKKSNTEKRMDETYHILKIMSEKPDECSLYTELLCKKLRAELPSPRRKQRATRSGGGNGHVRVSVRVSSALRLASDSRRGQNTVFRLLPTKLATKDGRRCSRLDISIRMIALNVFLFQLVILDIFYN